ncbi:MAG: hypothetical protein K0Q72_3029 [Armatimonadetes bacterium]|nr:hypothetical protein [Armatimonadota bacterium]
MMLPETPQEWDANLELDAGTTRLTVHVALPEDPRGEIGYLRLAFGHGGLANRLLNSVGEDGLLVTAQGSTYHVRITSTEPSGAPGYLCAFAVRDPARQAVAVR